MLDTPSFPVTGFDPGNRAYQRFGQILREHFDVMEWRREANDELVLTTVTDLDTGDAFSFTVIDSVEDQQPCAVLALRGGQLTTHGPVAGIAAACRHAPTVALTDRAVAATLGVRLHDPTVRTLPGPEWWYQHPPTGRLAVSRTSRDTAAVALILLDRSAERLAVVGPFDDTAAAHAWNPAEHQTATADLDRRVVELQPMTG